MRTVPPTLATIDGESDIEKATGRNLILEEFLLSLLLIAMLDLGVNTFFFERVFRLPVALGLVPSKKLHVLALVTFWPQIYS